MLRVASYNIRKAIGRDGRRDPARVLGVVTDLGADVVALQEADYRFKGRAAIFDPAEIARCTGLRVVNFGHGGPGLGWHGNVLLVGPRVEVQDKSYVELPGLEPRGGVMADAAIGGAGFRVVATHLGLLAKQRRRQARALVEAAELGEGGTTPRPTLVMGDFNGWGRSPPSLRLFEGVLNEAPCGRSFPAGRPITPLDRIYHTGPWRLAACGVFREGLARTASDHLPIWAEFALEQGRTDSSIL